MCFTYVLQRRIRLRDEKTGRKREGNRELNKFNENLSFIGLYANKKDKKHPRPSWMSRNTNSRVNSMSV